MPSLKACVVTSDKRIKPLKNSWYSIINEYGASELDLIAFQNPGSRGWEISSETLFVEI
jgi:phenylacetate-CoA ligase